MAGIKLFLWGHGYGSQSRMFFLDREADFQFETDLRPVAGAALQSALVDADNERKAAEEGSPQSES